MQEQLLNNLGRLIIDPDKVHSRGTAAQVVLFINQGIWREYLLLQNPSNGIQDLQDEFFIHFLRHFNKEPSVGGIWIYKQKVM